MAFPQVVSLSSLGGASDGPSESPAMSWDGRYVAFYSQARNLVSEGASGNVFVRDTCLNATGCIPQTTAVDLGPEGIQANGKVGRQVQLSGDGRFVAFISRATNLVGDAGNSSTSGFTELYMRDLCTGPNAYSNCAPHTELISIGADGVAADGPSSRPSVSADGRYVAFESSASNLVAGTLSLQPGIYVRDTCNGPTATKSCVARTFAVAMDDIDRVNFAQGARPAISGTGRYVAFEAWTGTEAVVGGAPGATETAQVVVADTCLGVDAAAGCRPSAARVSVAADASTIAGSNFSPSISANGRLVAFESQPVSAGAVGASSAGAGAPNASRVFVRDTCAGAANCVPGTVQISADAATALSGKSEVFSPALSPSGRYVSYVAAAASSGSSSEGTLQVRDMCYGAGRSCVPHTFAVAGPMTVSTGCTDPGAAAANGPSGSSLAGGLTGINSRRCH